CDVAHLSPLSFPRIRPSVLTSLFFPSYSLGAHRVLHSFPTRRSSDLRRAAAAARERLLDLAAARWNLDRSALEVAGGRVQDPNRSEEHTSELQSRFELVCRLLLEKKNIMTTVEHASELQSPPDIAISL